MRVSPLRQSKKVRAGSLLLRTSHEAARRGEDLAYLYFFVVFLDWSFKTLFTIFCSSMRKALMILSLTLAPESTPPYGRWTVRSFLLVWLLEPVAVRCEQTRDEKRNARDRSVSKERGGKKSKNTPRREANKGAPPGANRSTRATSPPQGREEGGRKERKRALTLGWPQDGDSVEDLLGLWVDRSVGLLGDIVEDLLATRGSDLLDAVALSGVRVPPSVSQTLHHLVLL